MADGFEELRSAYLSWRSLAERGLEEGGRAARDSPPGYTSVSAIVACGVGGSGIVGDYLAKLSEQYGGVPVYTVRGTEPPIFASRDTLVLGVSFSGETLETIRCVRQAQRRGAKVAVVAGPGRLSKLAGEEGWPAARVEKGPAARSMFASLFYTALGFLTSLGLIHTPSSAIRESLEALEGSSAEDEAVRIAEALRGTRLVLVAAGWELAPVALRVQQELAENAKKASLALYSPESLHNMIEGIRSLEGMEQVAALLIDWDGYTAGSLYEYLSAHVSKTASRSASIRVRGGLLAAMLRATLVAGLASIHLARLEDIDPASIPRIKDARRLAEESIRV